MNRNRRIRRSRATPGVMHRPGHAPGGRATRAAPVVFADLVRNWYRPDERGSHDERG
jgi:hypothetical protein